MKSILVFANYINHNSYNMRKPAISIFGFLDSFEILKLK